MTKNLVLKFLEKGQKGEILRSAQNDKSKVWVSPLNSNLMNELLPVIGEKKVPRSYSFLELS